MVWFYYIDELLVLGAYWGRSVSSLRVELLVGIVGVSVGVEFEGTSTTCREKTDLNREGSVGSATYGFWHFGMRKSVENNQGFSRMPPGKNLT
jgi:hypothetical protein